MTAGEFLWRDANTVYCHGAKDARQCPRAKGGLSAAAGACPPDGRGSKADSVRAVRCGKAVVESLTSLENDVGVAASLPAADSAFVKGEGFHDILFRTAGVEGDSPIFDDHGFAAVPAKIGTVPRTAPPAITSGDP